MSTHEDYLRKRILEKLADLTRKIETRWNKLNDTEIILDIV